MQRAKKRSLVCGCDSLGKEFLSRKRVVLGHAIDFLLVHGFERSRLGKLS